MREFERGSASFSPAGFEGFEAARRRRLEACLRRCARAASAADWVLGVFDANQDLVAFDSSAAEIDDRTALALLCVVPFPSSAGPVAINLPPGQSPDLPAALGISAGIGPKHSVAIVLLHRGHSNEEWSPAADAIRTAIDEVADELGNVYAGARNGKPPADLDGPDAFFLLSSTYEVDVEWFRNGESGVFAELVRPEARRLPIFLDQAVRRLTASWDFSRIGTCAGRMSHPLHGLALRVVPMLRNEVYAGVFLDVREDGRKTDQTVSTFRISSREREVLHALLDGRSIAEIAQSLNLAESTINDHVARMISKTKTRNRIQMAATLLGWPAIRPQLSKNGDHHAARSTAGDEQDEQGQDGERQRPRPSWRYNIGSGGPLHPSDWLP